MIKKIIFIVSLLLSMSIFSNESIQIKRYAILVGANNGGDERAILRYAETDAKMIASVFSDIGGIENSNSILLLNPTKDSLIRSFKKLSNFITKIESEARTEVVFYYSGHSDEEGLLIRDDHLSYKDLKRYLDNTNADVKIGILDSCSSGAFTRLKGGRHNAPFLVDESIKTEGHAYITSAAEDEAAQESNRLQASFFTHYLVSALRGAADTSADGKVSLHEAYSYASNETLARTESTQAGAQHASYDFRLSGSGDLVLTDLRDAESHLVLVENDFGRFFIRDSQDNLISEVNKRYGSPLKISVPASKYTIIKEVDGLYSKQVIPLNSGYLVEVDPNRYESFTPESNVSRGHSPSQIEYDLNVPDSTAFLSWTTMDKIRATNMDINFISKAGSLEGFQMSFGNFVVNDAYGAQVAAFLNVNGGDLSGLQFSGLFNVTGGNIENWGVQFSGLFNSVARGSDSLTFQNSGLFNTIGLDTEGFTFQNSGLFNIIGGNSHSFTWQMTGIFNKSKDINGFQLSGILNLADELKGAQISSIYNKAADVYGAQIALINFADYVYGTQIGIINVNKDIKGLSLGFLNISTEGRKNFSYRYNGSNREHYLDYQFGSSYFYNILYVGLPTNIFDIDRVNFGLGFGFYIPLGLIYTEIDLSLNNKISYSPEEEFRYNGGYPNINIKVGVPIWKDIAVFIGTSIEFPQVTNLPDDYNEEMYNLEDFKQTYFFGIRF